MTILQLVDIDVRYGAALALRKANLEIAMGTVVGVVGPNGAGKTTLLRTISGGLRPSGGSLVWKGRAASRLDPHRAVRMGIAHVPEGRRLIAELDVAENLRIGAVAAGRPSRNIDAVLQLFPPIEPLLRRKAGLLSGGEQQMVAIGRGLMAGPELLLVDELSLGLAPMITLELLSSLRALSEGSGLAVLMVDQNVRLLSRYVDSLWALSHGTIAEIDATTDARDLDAYVAEDRPE